MNSKLRFLMIAIATGAIVWTLLTWALPRAGLVESLAAHSTFPPSFDGHRMVYGVALAGLMAIVSLATNVLFEDIRFLKSFRGRWNEPAKLAVTINSLFLITIILGFAPDAVLLLAWGEEGAPSIDYLADLDRALDFFCIIPFSIAWLIRARARPIIHQQLLRLPIPTGLDPRRQDVRQKLLMLILILSMSFGVALTK